MNKLKKYIILSAIALLPTTALGAVSDFKSLTDLGIDLVKMTVNLLMSVAVLVFLFGLVKYIIEGDKDAKRTEGRKFMVWGIISLFVMVSIWSLVGILSDTLF